MMAPYRREAVFDSVSSRHARRPAENFYVAMRLSQRLSAFSSSFTAERKESSVKSLKYFSWCIGLSTRRSPLNSVSIVKSIAKCDITVCALGLPLGGILRVLVVAP